MRKQISMCVWTALAGAVAVVLPSCTHVPPHAVSRVPLAFSALIVPAEIQRDSDGELRVCFVVGPSGCWHLEAVDVVVDGATIQVSGTSVNNNEPDQRCTDAIKAGNAILPFPAVPAGTYDVVAGGLTARVSVKESPAAGETHVVYLGTLMGIGNGCVWDNTGNLTFAFDGLPEGLVGWHDHLVRGSLAEALSCPAPEWTDYRVGVTEVEEPQ